MNFYYYKGDRDVAVSVSLSLCRDIGAVKYTINM